jgi:hypothetical protein
MNSLKVQWRYWWKVQDGSFIQQDGSMTISGGGTIRDVSMSLAANKYTNFTISEPMYFQADLMLLPGEGIGSVNLGLSTEQWFSECYIRHDGSPSCWDARDAKKILVIGRVGIQ